MVNFVNMRKNFSDTQKRSSLQCRHADEVFWTLVTNASCLLSYRTLKKTRYDLSALFDVIVTVSVNLNDNGFVSLF